MSQRNTHGDMTPSCCASSSLRYATSDVTIFSDAQGLVQIEEKKKELVCSNFS